MGSFFKLYLLVAGLCVVSFKANAVSPLIGQQKLLDLIKRTEGTNLASGCFEKYKPQLSNISEEFEATYTSCRESVQQNFEALVDGNFVAIMSLVNSTKNIMDVCVNLANKTNNYDFFECFAKNATSHKTNIYNITRIASDGIAKTHGHKRQINIDVANCTSEAEAVFVTKSVTTYDRLKSCLNGEEQQSTTTTTAPTSKARLVAGAKRQTYDSDEVLLGDIYSRLAGSSSLLPLWQPEN